MAVVAAPSTASRHAVHLPEDSFDLQNRGLRQDLVCGGYDAGAIKQIGVLLVLGDRHNLEIFLRQKSVKRFRGTRPAVLDTPPASEPLLPADYVAVLHHENPARAPQR